MKENKLRKLIQLFKESQLEELEIQHSFWRGTRVKLRRQHPHPPAYQPVDTAPSPRTEPAISAAPEEAPPDSPGEDAGEGLHDVTSPMVGTFYPAASPDDDPFVRQGDQVEPGQTVCIVEAMKIMNEIEADVEGEVVEILVGEAEPVEYNQPLMRIRPS